MSSEVKLPKTQKVKHKKVLRDNIQGISRPALQRILRRAGVKRMSGSIYEELRSVMEKYMGGIIKDIVIFVEHDRRRTIQIDDLNAALDMHKIFLAAGLNPNTKKTKSIQSCNSKGKSGPVKKSKAREEGYPDGRPDGVNKKFHRFRPGTRALRAIRYQQKNSDCLAILKANFDRLTREISQRYGEHSLRFSEGVVELLQLVVEGFLIDLCIDSYRCTLFANRDTIYPKDVQLAQSIRKDM